MRDPFGTGISFRLFSVAAILLVSATALFAQIRIANPSLPASEHIVYTERIGSETRVIDQRTVLKSDKGKSWYEYVSSSPDSDILLRMDKDTLLATYSETTTRGKDSVIRRTTEILKTTVALKEDELLVSDFNALAVTLRGFPWGTTDHARLVFLGQANQGMQFSIDLNVQGKETVTANGKPYECWKVQIGVGGVYGAFMGKTYLWYAVDSPHYLVRSEGALGPPGSPQRVLEMNSYGAGTG
jgi:hypothetical protein